LAWGIEDIEEFWSWPPQKRALYISAIVTKSQMQAHEDELMNKEMKQRAPKSGM